MANLRNATFQSQAKMASYTDSTGVYQDYDSTAAAGAANGFAQFGAKGVGGLSIGAKIRTLLAGVVVDAVTFLANGAATFAAAVVFSSSLTAQAVTANGLITLNGVTDAVQVMNHASGAHSSYFDLRNNGLSKWYVGKGPATNSDAYEIYNVVSGALTLSIASATNNITWTTPAFIVGTDPGGSQLLRVGGSVIIGGVATIFGTTTSQIIIDATAGNSTDASQLSFRRNGAVQWLMGNNVSTGSDAFDVFSAGVGVALSINRTTRAATFSGPVIITALPTSSAGLPSGALWNSSGTVHVV